MCSSPAPETDATLGPPQPQENLTLLGHQGAEQEILKAWQSGRMHHAWLITGKRGSGKATFAYRVARFLLAQGGSGKGGEGLFADAPPTSLDQPTDSQVVRLVAQGAHPDLRVLQREWDDKRKRRKGEIIVDSVRTIGGFLSLTAADGGWRVVIVDAADQMNRNAANAILKILEEPPKRSILLLLAHNPARLLPTIRSRCRVLKLSLLEDGVVSQLLQRYAPELSPDDAQALAYMGEGSIGRALELHAAGGLHHYQAMIALLRGLPTLDVLALHGFADNAIKGDEGFRITTTLFLWWLGRALAAAGRGESPLEVVPGENALIRALAVSAPLDQWVQVWEKVSRLFDRTEVVNLDKKQVLISAFGAVERLVRPH